MPKVNEYNSHYISNILKNNKRIASVGVSLNSVRPSFMVARWLSLRGYSITPINPSYEGQVMWGNTTCRNLTEVTQPIDMVQIFRKSEAVPEIVEEAIHALPNLKTIWMQIGVEHQGAALFAKSQGVEVVQNLCPKMELQRFSGELGRYGVNTGFVSSRRFPLETH
jgi:predicted CoA-binding protein